MRPAKSFWNQPTDWRSTWRCERQRTMVPTFGISDWLSRSALSVWISGRANRMKSATSPSSSPWRAQTSAGGVSPSTSTRRPAYQISAISRTATAKTETTVQTMTRRAGRRYSARNGQSRSGGVSDSE